MVQRSSSAPAAPSARPDVAHDILDAAFPRHRIIASRIRWWHFWAIPYIPLGVLAVAFRLCLFFTYCFLVSAGLWPRKWKDLLWWTNWQSIAFRRVRVKAQCRPHTCTYPIALSCTTAVLLDMYLAIHAFINAMCNGNASPRRQHPCARKAYAMLHTHQTLARSCQVSVSETNVVPCRSGW